MVARKATHALLLGKGKMQAVDRAGVGAAVVTSALGEFAWRIGWGCVAGGLLALIAGVVLLWHAAPVEVGPPSLATPLAVANGRAPGDVGPSN